MPLYVRARPSLPGPIAEGVEEEDNEDDERSTEEEAEDGDEQQLLDDEPAAVALLTEAQPSPRPPPSPISQLPTVLSSLDTPFLAGPGDSPGPHQPHLSPAALKSIYTPVPPALGAALSKGDLQPAESEGALNDQDPVVQNLLRLAAAAAQCPGMSWRVGVSAPMDEMDAFTAGAMAHTVMGRQAKPAVSDLDRKVHAAHLAHITLDMHHTTFGVLYSPDINH